jgi:hypothetical protein
MIPHQLAKTLPRQPPTAVPRIFCTSVIPWIVENAAESSTNTPIRPCNSRLHTAEKAIALCYLFVEGGFIGGSDIPRNRLPLAIVTDDFKFNRKAKEREQQQTASD